jgi:hypothetical protein
MPGDRKRSGKRCRQYGRREAGLRGGVVLVDDPTEHVVASNDAERRGSRGLCADRCGHIESKAAVRPMLIVMLDVVAKDCFEMMTAENERPVEALFTDGPYPALRDRVRSGRSHRCLDVNTGSEDGSHTTGTGGWRAYRVLSGACHRSSPLAVSISTRPLVTRSFDDPPFLRCQ